MQRRRLILSGYHFLGRGAVHQEREHRAAARTGVAVAAHEPHAERAVQRGGVRMGAVVVAAVHLKWESWTKKARAGDGGLAGCGQSGGVPHPLQQRRLPHVLSSATLPWQRWAEIHPEPA